MQSDLRLQSLEQTEKSVRFEMTSSMAVLKVAVTLIGEFTDQASLKELRTELSP